MATRIQRSYYKDDSHETNKLQTALQTDNKTINCRAFDIIQK
jgi:hypothetical protein